MHHTGMVKVFEFAPISCKIIRFVVTTYRYRASDQSKKYSKLSLSMGREFRCVSLPKKLNQSMNNVNIF